LTRASTPPDDWGFPGGRNVAKREFSAMSPGERVLTDQAKGLSSETSPLAEIEAYLRGRRSEAGPFIIGVTGSVAAGKSVFSNTLKAALEAWPGPPSVELAATDGFLLPNARLEALGLSNDKGFPTSYDTETLRAALTAVRAGPAVFPGYSHVTYDVDPGLARTIDAPDILIVEGLDLRLNAPGAARAIDVLIYLDAEEADLEAWFVARFMGLWAAAEHDPTSFYVRFRGMTPEQAKGFAQMVWTGINLRNLREHIVHARAEADLVVRKGLDHAIVSVAARG
jgi:type I pantothenate kinase